MNRKEGEATADPLVLPDTATDASLAARYRAVRALTERLCDGLEREDFVVQSSPDVSPTKWHLAHTTWFWETFVLTPHAPGYALHDERYPFLFNSYYVQAGARHCRAQRGYLSRPTVDEVFAYRAHVDRAMEHWLAAADLRFDGLAPDTPAGDGEANPLADLVEIGLNHEQQHQELMLTDLKHVFSVNPLRPVYRERTDDGSTGLTTEGTARDPGPAGWLDVEAGVYEVGFAPTGDATSRERFHFDNEGPRHRAFLEPFALADRLVTAGEVLAFIADGGYARPELWLSLGWATREAEGWTCPFYWEPDEASPAGFRHFTLAGMRDVDPHEPATHLSYFEADAVARWMDVSGRVPGARLPTEVEWEVAARAAWDGTGDAPGSGFVDGGRLHPAPAVSPAGGDGSAALITGGAPAPALRQLYGEVWQWTQSQYTPYPGYRPVPGALGEYNGKFMANQFVLRGASCFTSRSHARPTYRNFFPPEATWQMTGLRLARSR